MYTHTALSCNVSETLIYMWQNTWESRRPRHTRVLDDQQLLAVEGSKSPKTPGTQLREEESENAANAAETPSNRLEIASTLSMN